ncbi:hypothetical protein PL8927_690194 [Planktothrix serta PCC 8927]|uniref:Uncharacterized protein n=1 Tax=Planktothrix serta PCC 8927 TaxID=671068 RepID=A0A7Z9BVT3_9CYAN|nr:hypothetical protein PL8927_690194 [Planktothrix serta PCC 8927]
MWKEPQRHEDTKEEIKGDISWFLGLGLLDLSLSISFDGKNRGLIVILIAITLINKEKNGQ